MRGRLLSNISVNLRGPKTGFRKNPNHNHYSDMRNQQELNSNENPTRT